jgi:hypothetical protein
MSFERKSPRDVARALAERSRSHARAKKQGGTWRRETFTMSRPEARAKAREWFDQYPKAAYMTDIESWREMPGDQIEFTMRRLPTAD